MFSLLPRKGMVISAALLFILFFMGGCTATRFLKEGETFYEGAEIELVPQGKIGRKKAIKKDLEPYIRPKPNGKFLGSRPGVWFYYIAGTPKKKKGLKSLIKNKLGKVPVLLSDVEPDQITSALETELNNEGYFGSTVTNEIKAKSKTSKVIYTAILEPPFTLATVTYQPKDSAYSELFKKFKKESLLKKDQRYRLERLKVEQARMEEVAKDNGYYFFDDRYLLFEADTTIGKRKIDITLSFEEGTPDKVRRLYTMRSINVYPNYSLGNDSLSTTGDTVMVNHFKYIDNQHAFRPKVITEVINLQPDSIYRKIDHEYTLSRLMSLKVFKFVNVKMIELADSSLLDAHVYLTPLLKKSLRLQVQGVSKSNNFVGPGIEVTFTNRNFLRGAELFQFKLNGAYEWQISRQQAGALNAVELGSSASLAVPRFITPIPIHYRSAKYLPQTEFKAAYSLQQRLQYFRLTSFNIGVGYTWRETTLKTHQLFPVDLSFVQKSHTSVEFDDRLENDPTLANAFQNQFIPGARYSFTYNSQLREDIEQKYKLKKESKSNFYLNVSADWAGNIIHAFQSINAERKDSLKIFGSPYAQYALSTVDVRYYLQLDQHQKLATRIVMGAGFAFGNSTQLPYIKQFAVGGSTSLRAFPARSVGPGTYNVRTDAVLNDSTRTTFFIDQRGDFKLEGSVEYRFDIWKALKGAVFVDAGNIWLRNQDDNDKRKGGKFNKDTFLNELAVGTGVGLRYDFNFFVFRFDLAFPIRKPYLEPENRWVFDQIDFGSSEWRKDNLILNIAIGYPF